MRVTWRVAVVTALVPVAAVCFSAPASRAETGRPHSIAQATGDAGAPAGGLPIYKPPPAKYPRARVGGVTRGSLGKDPMVVALVPDHVALTSHTQPTLYWYISQATPLPIIFTLREDEAVRPILEVPLAPPKQPGIQLVRLKDFGVKLKEKTVYRWFISVQRDPDSPSQDIVTGGMIELVNLVEILTLQLSAEKGLWYDAMMIVCENIEKSPEDKLLRQQRACLLDQVGLTEIGDLDRSLVPNGKRCPHAVSSP
jgi:hypothetical protein